MIAPTAAIEAAKRGLEQLGLQRNPGVALALAHAKAGEPLFVKRLDAPDRDYYLVPWLGERGIELIVQVHALSAEMLSAVPLPKPLSHLVISPHEARRVVEGLDRCVTGEPQLVWRPCRESYSPLQPFYQVSTEKGDVFVGADGSVYPSLTSSGKGG